MSVPPVSVIVPFRGSGAAAERMRKALAGLQLGSDGELIVADNTREGLVEAGREWRAVRATRERSAYHARNRGAAAASGEWLLFLDADCIPGADLLDRYFDPPPGARAGAVAGQIMGERDQPGLAARYARSRHLFDHERGLIRASEGGAGAGNLLVRRRTFEELGGFAEGIRSGGDMDLCRRLRSAGWELEFRPGALAHHRHRGSITSLLGAFARYGAGARWLEERHPGTSRPWPLMPGLVGSARDIARNLARGRLEEALFRAIDAGGLIASHAGYRASNRALGV